MSTTELNELAQDVATIMNDYSNITEGQTTNFDVRGSNINRRSHILLPYLRRAYETGKVEGFVASDKQVEATLEKLRKDCKVDPKELDEPATRPIEPGTRFWRDADGNVCSKIGDDGGDVSPFVGTIRNGSLKQRPVEPVEKPKLSAAEIAKLKEEITASNEQTKKDSRVDTDTWKMEFSSQLAEPVEKPKPEKFSIGDRVTIRGGALVGQDMKQIRWKNTDKVFTIVNKVYNEMRYGLMGDGYGEPDSYGNGCLYANALNMILVEPVEEPQTVRDILKRIHEVAIEFTHITETLPLEIDIESQLAAKDAEATALREENEKLKDYRTEVFEIEKILGRWEEIRDNQI